MSGVARLSNDAGVVADAAQFFSVAEAFVVLVGVVGVLVAVVGMARLLLGDNARNIAVLLLLVLLLFVAAAAEGDADPAAEEPLFWQPPATVTGMGCPVPVAASACHCNTRAAVRLNSCWTPAFSLAEVST